MESGIKPRKFDSRGRGHTKQVVLVLYSWYEQNGVRTWIVKQKMALPV